MIDSRFREATNSGTSTLMFGIAIGQPNYLEHDYANTSSSLHTIDGPSAR